MDSKTCLLAHRYYKVNVMWDIKKKCQLYRVLRDSNAHMKYPQPEYMTFFKYACTRSCPGNGIIISTDSQEICMDK